MGQRRISDLVFANAAILNQSLMDFAIYRRSLVVAAEFNRTEEELIVNVMYSNLALHGIPISLNLIMNSVLKAFAGDQYSIEAANSPLSSDSVTIPRGWNLSVSIVWLCLVPLGKDIFAFVISVIVGEVSHKKLQTTL